MNWKAKIFKPGWESRKAEKRLQSVTDDNDQGLWNALPETISSDTDFRVRLAAFKRLLSVKSKDPIKRFTFILERFNSLATDPQANDKEQQSEFKAFKQQLAQHIQRDLLNLTIDTEIAANYLLNNASAADIETLAKRAKSINVRLAAIRHIDANGLLGDIAIKENEPSLSRFAVSRIEQISTLERVAKAIRTRDKKLHQRIQERLFESGTSDSAEISEHEAEAICNQLEQMLRAVGSGVHPDPALLKAQWENLQTPATQAQQQRYTTLLSTITSTIDGSALKSAQQKVLLPEPVVVEPEPEPVSVPEAEAEAELKSAPSKQEKSAEEVKEDTEKTSIDAAQIQKEQREKKRTEQKLDAQNKANDIHTKQDELAEAIEAVDLKKAVKYLHTIRKDLSALRKNRLSKAYLSALEGRETRLHGKVKGLRDYQHWANNKIRAEMVEQLQSISTVNLHPDAVKNTLADARKKWQALEASEQLPGDKYFHAPASLWRQFDQTCDLAFKLIQPFLEKRNKIQTEHLHEDRGLLEAGKELLDNEDAEVNLLLQHQRKLGTAIRELEKIPAKQRGKTARNIRAQLNSLKSRIGSGFEEIENKKLALIRQAEQLSHSDDQREAIQQAKQLQRQWQAAGSGSRKKDQALWETFRGHLNPLFTAQTEKHDAEKEASKQQTEQQKELCLSLESINKLKLAEQKAQSGKVQSINQDWQTLGGTRLHKENKLNLRFLKANQLFQAALLKSLSQQQMQSRKNWGLKDKLLLKLLTQLQAEPESATSSFETTKGKWPLAETSNPIDKLLDSKLLEIEKQLGNKPFNFELENSESIQNQYRDLCLTLEYLAGLGSPKAEKQNRMDMQIKRLAENLSGEVLRLPLAEEVSQLETSWYQLPMIAEDSRKKYTKRFQLAIKELLSQINTSAN